MSIEYCADIIAFREDELVLIERLTEPQGLALPGGRQEMPESLTHCALREFEEETGMSLSLLETWRTYSEPERDPRGPKTTTVFVGIAHGTPRNEDEKTQVLLLSPRKIEGVRESFVFDHYEILKSYLNSH